MSRVFITGGAGLIGSHTARELIGQGHEVTVFDSFQQYAVPHGCTFQENLDYRFSRLLAGARIMRGSTEHPARLGQAVREADPEYVIHLAALPLVSEAASTPEEALASIVQGTVNLLAAVEGLTGLQRVVYVSSSMAYGDFATVPVPEDAAKDPVNVYGALKFSGELLVRAAGRQKGLPYTIVRPSAVYGPGDNNRRVVQMFAERALQGLPIKVANPESTFLDFTHVQDLARGLAAAALTPAGRAEEFNITCGTGRSLAELVDILRRYFPGLEAQESRGEDVRVPKRGSLDIGKARRLLGYEPEFSLEEGLADYLGYMKSFNTSLTACA